MINVNTASKDKKYVVKQIDIQNKNMLYRLGAFGLNVGSKISIKQKCLLNGETCDASSPKMENMKTVRKWELKHSTCILVL